ncbi:E3 ubiquitin-protein ligase tom1 [Binucleata daphniae]
MQNENHTDAITKIETFINITLKNNYNNTCLFYLKQCTEIWPFTNSKLNTWADLIDSFEAFFCDIVTNHFHTNLQTCLIRKKLKKKIIVILNFIQVLLENTYGKTKTKILNHLLILMHSYDYEIAKYTILCIRTFLKRKTKSIMKIRCNPGLSQINLFFEVIDDKQFSEITEDIAKRYTKETKTSSVVQNKKIQQTSKKTQQPNKKSIGKKGNTKTIRNKTNDAKHKNTEQTHNFDTKDRMHYDEQVCAALGSSKKLKSIYSINLQLHKYNYDKKATKQINIAILQYKLKNKFTELQFLYASIYILIFEAIKQDELTKIYSESYKIVAKNKYDEMTESVFIFYAASAEKKVGTEKILEALKMNQHNGHFIYYLKNIANANTKFITFYFSFINALFISSKELYNCIIELDILFYLQKILEEKKQRNLHAKTEAVNVLIRMINSYSHEFVGDIQNTEIFSILYEEIIYFMQLLPKNKYFFISDKIYTVEINEKHKKEKLCDDFIRTAVKFVDEFYHHKNRTQLIYSDLFTCKMNMILYQIYKNFKTYRYSTLNHALNIIINYINSLPLNIYLLEEHNFLPVIFNIYSDIPPHKKIIECLVDLINALTLQKKMYHIIIENKLLDKVLHTMIEYKYTNILKTTNSGSVLCVVFEELIRHHPEYKNNVLAILKDLIKEISEEKFYKKYHSFVLEENYANLTKHKETTTRESITSLHKESVTSAYEDFFINLICFYENLINLDDYSIDDIKEVSLGLIEVQALPLFINSSDYDNYKDIEPFFDDERTRDIHYDIAKIMFSKIHGTILVEDVNNISVFIHSMNIFIHY